MADDYRSLVRGIADTEKLTGKVDKALKDSAEAKKESIETKRVVAIQLGDGTKGTQTGNNGSGGSSTGIGNNGGTVVGPLAPPQSAGNSLQNAGSSTANNDSSYQSNNGHGTSQTPGIGNSVNNNDMSSQGNSPLYGGSAAANQALQGVNDSEWQDLYQALVDAGKSPEEIDEYRKQWLQYQAGTYDVGDVYEGDAGPKPSVGSTAEMQGQVNPPPRKETLNAVVGVDPDNEEQAMYVAITSQQSLYVPNPEDQAAAGEPEWLWTGEAPDDPNWELGKMWEIAGLGPPFDGTSFATPAEAAQFGEDSYNSTPTGILFPATFDHYEIVNSTTTNLHYDRAAGDFYITITKINCAGSAYELDAEVCPLIAPTLDHWAISGTYILNRIGGFFVGNTFDSELPEKYQGQQNSATIKSLATGDTYIIEPGIEGGTIIRKEDGTDGALYYAADGTLRATVPNEFIKFYQPREVANQKLYLIK